MFLLTNYVFIKIILINKFIKKYFWVLNIDQYHFKLYWDDDDRMLPL